MANIFGDIIAILGLHVHTIDHLKITDTSTQVVFTILVSYVILCLCRCGTTVGKHSGLWKLCPTAIKR